MARETHQYQEAVAPHKEREVEAIKGARISRREVQVLDRDLESDLTMKHWNKYIN